MSNKEQPKHIKIVDTISNIGKAENYILLNADFKRFLKAKYGKSDLLKVDAHQIVEKYNLLGITFGNYVTQEERYHFLFKIEKQLEVLANIKGNNNIGLGKLIISFGVEGFRGSAAHFSPKKLLINLNRGRKGSYTDVMQGENSFLHEYGHFIDFIQGRKDLNIPTNFASENTTGKGSPLTKKYSNVVDIVETNESYMQILKDYKPKTFSKYLLKRVEIFARVFECALTYYIVDKWPSKEAFFDVKKYGIDYYPKKDYILKEKLGQYCADILKGKTLMADYEKFEKEQKKKEEKPTVKQGGNYPFSADDIPYQTAYNAHSGTSFSPEKRAKQEQQSYFNFLKEVYDKYKEKAEKTNRIEEFEKNFTRYQKGYLKRFLNHLQTRNGLVSTMITGPANFPVRRMEKKNDAIHKRLNELVDFGNKAEKYILPIKSNAIKTGQSDSLTKLEEKLKKLEARQEMYKNINKLVRKYQGAKYKNKDTNEKMELIKKEAAELGIAGQENLRYLVNGNRIEGFYLTNNSAEIRRIKQRIKREKALQDLKEQGNKEYPFPGGKVIYNFDINRFQIKFDDKPDAETRKFLKGRGHAFKWSPKNGVWQRQLDTYYKLSRRELLQYLKVANPDKKETEKYYIEYLDKENNFRQTKKPFTDYEKAKEWGKSNLDNFNLDMIKIS